MLKNQDIFKILFIDIETVAAKSSFDELPLELQEFWIKKAKYIPPREKETSPEDLYSEKAGIYAEFGKIICISVGFLIPDKEKKTIDSFRVKSFYGDDEKALLQDFFQSLDKYLNNNTYKICGHNIKEFDIPYICRRSIINGLNLPSLINIAGKKPWEIPHLDTMDLWRFGDYKNYTSLSLLNYILDIPSSKDDIDGSDVGHVYWQDNNLPRIVKYCEKDVLAVAQLILKFMNIEILRPAQIISVKD